ncbi:hypothetical protein BC826DRAFT_973969 [Russula brevipes]|nr:hypothetical protein BC826DRAFT_973969 [Russula brevipes]
MSQEMNLQMVFGPETRKTCARPQRRHMASSTGLQNWASSCHVGSASSTGNETHIQRNVWMRQRTLEELTLRGWWCASGSGYWDGSRVPSRHVAKLVRVFCAGPLGPLGLERVEVVVWEWENGLCMEGEGNVTSVWPRHVQAQAPGRAMGDMVTSDGDEGARAGEGNEGEGQHITPVTSTNRPRAGVAATLAWGGVQLSIMEYTPHTIASMRGVGMGWSPLDDVEVGGGVVGIAIEGAAGDRLVGLGARDIGSWGVVSIGLRGDGGRHWAMLPRGTEPRSYLNLPHMSDREVISTKKKKTSVNKVTLLQHDAAPKAKMEIEIDEDEKELECQVKAICWLSDVIGTDMDGTKSFVTKTNQGNTNVTPAGTKMTKGCKKDVRAGKKLLMVFNQPLVGLRTQMHLQSSQNSRLQSCHKLSGSVVLKTPHIKMRVTDLPEFTQADLKWRKVFVPSLYNVLFQSEAPFRDFILGIAKFMGIVQMLINCIYPEVNYTVKRDEPIHLLCISLKAYNCINEKQSSIGGSAITIIAKYLKNLKPIFYQKPTLQACPTDVKQKDYIRPEGQLHSVFIVELAQNYIQFTDSAVGGHGYLIGLFALILVVFEHAVCAYTNGVQHDVPEISDKYTVERVAGYMGSCSRLSDNHWNKILKACGVEN